MRMPVCDLVRALITFAALGVAASPLSAFGGDAGPAGGSDPSRILLPRPRLDGTTSLEAALAARRSTRSFKNRPVSLEELGQVLWAGQGITHQRGFRTVPSAGALYPLELFVVAGNVAGLPAGTYRYEPEGHALAPVAAGDRRADLADAALGQSCIRTAAAVLVIAAEERRTTSRYGERGLRYVHLEAGHAGQNISLQAGTLGLGTVMIGAFSDEAVALLLHAARLRPLYLIPLGRK